MNLLPKAHSSRNINTDSGLTQNPKDKHFLTKRLGFCVSLEIELGIQYGNPSIEYAFNTLTRLYEKSPLANPLCRGDFS